MSKIRGFFANLNKSTKITLVSCGCFIAMTALILGFFILFPITPSEKVIASFGRESVVKNKSSETQNAVTTANADSVELSKGTTNTSAYGSDITTTTRRKRFEIDVTTGSGFYSGGNILTGAYDPNYTWTPTTTTSADYDPDYPNGFPISPDDPVAGEYPTTSDPGIIQEPVDNPDPSITPNPGVTPDPGVDNPAPGVDTPGTDDPGNQTPVTPPESGGDSAGTW